MKKRNYTNTITLTINRELIETFRKKLKIEGNKSISNFVTEVMESYLFDYVEYTGAIDAYVKGYTDGIKHTEEKFEKLLTQ